MAKGFGMTKHHLFRCDIVSERSGGSVNKADHFNSNEQNFVFFLFTQSVSL
jgi:hypothetical protein